ncbi:hypothetical protein MMC16_005499 [Acarospora aff. strigata]|nr:hypothetical protein [Acarospora aff. strigata]
MSNYPGEERLLTLFADVHYYFGAPTPRPLHHRFDKGSYVYLYRDASKGRGRLEVANQPGKPEQDAFTGFLDSVHLRYSHKHPTLCTITVDGKELGHASPPPPPPQQESHHWRLPSMDPRDEGKFLFKLHTLDIYFWTTDDARLFVDWTKKILHQEQLEILDVPQAPQAHEQLMSPVVQQLENVAFEDPAYGNGQTRNSRTATVPLASPPLRERASPDTKPEALKAPEQPASYAPLAYNPAAPPAPEPIRHREKTPPPPDAELGTGLSAAAYADHGYAPPPTQHHPSVSSPLPGHTYQQQSFSGPPPQKPTSTYASPPPAQHHPSVSSPSPSHPYQQQSFSGPPQQPPPTSYTSPPPSAGLPYSPPPIQQGQRVSSISSFPPPPPTTASPAVATPPSRHQSVSFAPLPKDPNAHLYDPGKPSPTSQIVGNSYVAQPPQPLAHLQPQYPDYLQSRPQNQPPPGGYSEYDYNQPHQPHQHHHHHHHQSQGDGYDVHNQVYRPTETEGRHGHRRPSEAGPGQQPGRLEQGASKLEKKANTWLKKLDKRIG